MTTDAPQPVGWRDVHALVKESRDEILASVEKGFSGTSEILTGHGVRISALEQQNVIEAAARQARELLATELRTAELARDRKRDRFLSRGQQIFLVLTSVAGVVVTTLKTFGVF